MNDVGGPQDEPWADHLETHISTVFLAGDYAYVADEESDFKVIDVSDPTAPLIVGSCYAGDMLSDVAVAGGHAFATDFYSGLRVLDVSEPTAPHQVGALSLSLTDCIAVDGNYAYVTNWNCGLYVVDVSNIG